MTANPEMPAPARCPSCMGRNLARVIRQGEVRARGEVRAFDYEAYECPDCREEVLTLAQADAWEAARTALVREMKGLRSPAEIKAIRKTYRLSQAKLERVLGVGPKTVARWESGAVPQSRTADKLLMIAQQFPETFLSLAEAEGVQIPRAEALTRAYWVGRKEVMAAAFRQPRRRRGGSTYLVMVEDRRVWMVAETKQVPRPATAPSVSEAAPALPVIGGDAPKEDREIFKDLAMYA